MRKHIRIISPSGAIDDTYIKDACARLRTWGYEVSVAEHAYGKVGRFAGTDDERLADIKAAIDDPSVDVILCSRGGYGLQRIIDRVDCTDKLFVGFSDVTELLLHCWRHCVPAVHGLMCKHIATLPEDCEPIRNWRDAIEYKPLHYTLPSHPLNRLGEAESLLVGGNLSVIYGLQGTSNGLRDMNGGNVARGSILFIEDIAERHYHIDRMMNNLKMSGVLEGLSALIVGQFTNCDDDPSMGETVYETIRRSVDDYDYPVLFNFPAGHVENNMPLVIGAATHLSVGRDTCELVQTPEKVVSPNNRYV